MISANSKKLSSEPFADAPVKLRRLAQGEEPLIFTNIYEEETNIVTWKRELSITLQSSVRNFLASNPTFQAIMTVSSQSAFSSVRQILGTTDQFELSENIAELVDMFCCLFGLTHAGLRLIAMDRAMCPKFHADRVPCRLITTYQGLATEWLPHQVVDRTKLGLGSNGQSDSESGLFQNPSDIQQLRCGDVALLKGESWEGNENAGLVHRSPTLSAGEYRLLLTLDFVN